jgi:hypothetical protein
VQARALVVAVIVATFVGLFAAVRTSEAPPFASVTGNVKLTIPDYPAAGLTTVEQMMISAHDGPNGPSGSIEFRSPQSDAEVAKVDVTCIVVSGNDAWVGGTVREPFNYISRLGDPASRITHFGIQLRDNGPPGQGVPDAVHPVVFVDRVRPPTFTPCNIAQPLLPVSAGNLVLNVGS